MTTSRKAHHSETAKTRLRTDHESASSKRACRSQGMGRCFDPALRELAANADRARPVFRLKGCDPSTFFRAERKASAQLNEGTPGYPESPRTSRLCCHRRRCDASPRLGVRDPGRRLLLRANATEYQATRTTLEPYRPVLRPPRICRSNLMLGPSRKG